VVWISYSDSAIEVREKPDGLWGSGNWNPTAIVRHLTDTGFLGGRSVPPQPRRGIHNAPTIDVDRSGGPHTGRAYVTWVEGVVYPALTNVFLSYSDDGGTTWSANGSAGNVDNANATAFHPWVAVDQSSGAVSVLYRTNDGDSDTATAATRVAASLDGGQTFPSKADIADQRSKASVASYIGDYLDYTGFDVVDGTMHGFWSDNRGPNPGTYTSYLNSYSTMAGFQSQTGTNTLYVDGDDNGPSDDTILIRPSPSNAAFLEVVVNGQVQYDGLALTVNNLVVNGGTGNNTIVVQGSFPGISITLTAGDGRNLFIAGGLPVMIQGGAGDNILIGGSTQWDYDTTALAAIMAEWTRTDVDYSQRVYDLLNGGGLNGSYVLNASTVTGNGGGNTLLGNGGLNLYFGNPDFDVNDWDPTTETFVVV
jgi:hypothetical protein